MNQLSYKKVGGVQTMGKLVGHINRSYDLLSKTMEERSRRHFKDLWGYPSQHRPRVQGSTGHNDFNVAVTLTWPVSHHKLCSSHSGAMLLSHPRHSAG